MRLMSAVVIGVSPVDAVVIATVGVVMATVAAILKSE